MRTSSSQGVSALRTRRFVRRAAASLLTLLSLSFCAAAGAVFVLHLQIRPVLSGSMRPTYGPGSIIVTRMIPVSSVRAGTIIVFKPPGWSAPVAHRVVAVSASAHGPVFTTKGDANPAPDAWRAHLTGTRVPEVVGSVPLLGWAVAKIDQPGARVALTVAIGIAVLAIGLPGILRRPNENESARPSGIAHRGQHLAPRHHHVRRREA